MEEWEDNIARLWFRLKRLRQLDALLSEDLAFIELYYLNNGNGD